MEIAVPFQRCPRVHSDALRRQLPRRQSTCPWKVANQAFESRGTNEKCLLICDEQKAGRNNSNTRAMILLPRKSSCVRAVKLYIPLVREWWYNAPRAATFSWTSRASSPAYIHASIIKTSMSEPYRPILIPQSRRRAAGIDAIHPTPTTSFCSNSGNLVPPDSTRSAK